MQLKHSDDVTWDDLSYIESAASAVRKIERARRDPFGSGLLNNKVANLDHMLHDRDWFYASAAAHDHGGRKDRQWERLLVRVSSYELVLVSDRFSPPLDPPLRFKADAGQPHGGRWEIQERIPPRSLQHLLNRVSAPRTQIGKGSTPAAMAAGVKSEVGMVGSGPPPQAVSTAVPNTYGKSIKIDGDEEFRRKTIADLDKINSTLSGKKLLADIGVSGKSVTIKPAAGGNQVTGLSSEAMVKVDGTRGAGSNSTVHYNPDISKIGTESWQDRPPAIGLAHELIHAQHAAEGSVDVSKVNNDSRPDPADSTKVAQHFKEEIRTVGIEPYSTESYSENKIRSEWNPKQPERPWY